MIKLNILSSSSPTADMPRLSVGMIRVTIIDNTHGDYCTRSLLYKYIAYDHYAQVLDIHHVLWDKHMLTA